MTELIPARDARQLAETLDLDAPLAAINALITKTAPTATSVDLPSTLLPGRHMASWMVGNPTEPARRLQKLLQEAGYHVKCFGGGHSGNGSVSISW